VTYDEDVIRSALRTEWHLRPSLVADVPTGWLTRAWTVTAEGDEYVARLVDAGCQRSLEAGLAASEHLRARGVTIGRPVRTLAGALTVTTGIGAIGLVRRVTGRTLAGADPIDQQWWGDRLGAAHRALEGFQHPGLRRWHWLQPDGVHLMVQPWLRAAVGEALAATTRLTVTDRLTYGVLHGDPAPAAFLVDPATGRTGLVDWGPCAAGPLVYDLAAAVVYAGGPAHADALLDSYLAAGPVPRDEVDAALPVLLRFRWAVQADWYARRLAGAAPPGGGAGFAVEADAALGGLRRAREALGTLTAGG